MSNHEDRQAVMAAGFFILVWIALFIGAFYAAAHFIVKFW